MGRAAHLPSEAQVPPLAAAPPRYDDPLDLVAPRGERLLDPLDEGA